MEYMSIDHETDAQHWPAKARLRSSSKTDTQQRWGVLRRRSMDLKCWGWLVLQPHWLHHGGRGPVGETSCCTEQRNVCAAFRYASLPRIAPTCTPPNAAMSCAGVALAPLPLKGLQRRTVQALQSRAARQEPRRHLNWRRSAEYAMETSPSTDRRTCLVQRCASAPCPFSSSCNPSSCW